jgi:hypothetical protein
MRRMAVAIVMALIGGGFLAAAYFSYVDQNTGPEVQARISSCSGQYGRFVNEANGVTCQASWVIGGALVGGGGHVVTGELEDAEDSDAGRTISVHLHGGTAYPTKDGVRLPIVFIVLSLPGFILAGSALRNG